MEKEEECFVTEKVNAENVRRDIDQLEREVNDPNSEWNRGWTQGRNYAIKDLEAKLLPKNDRILKAAEIAFRILQKQFGNVFSRVFAGFNCYYDEPSVLVCLKPGEENKKNEIAWFSVAVEQCLSDIDGVLPISILVTRESNTNFDVVSEDMLFEKVSANA